MYHFYMGSVLLPIAPEKLNLKVNSTNKKITLINEGEVNILKDAGLTDIEFDALIPAVEYTFAKYTDKFKNPKYFTDYFEELKTSKKPFQFIVVRTMPNGKMIFNTNMTVSIESYTIKEDAKQGFDLVVSFKLKQYRSFGTKIVKVIEPSTTNKTANKTANKTTSASTSTSTSKNNKVTVTVKERPKTTSPEPKKETTYKVKSGDTLWGIAKKFYGDGSKYNKIYEANKDKIKNPNVIFSGQVLVIPSA